MAKITKDVKALLSQVIPDRNRNLRLTDDATYDVTHLKADLAINGQQVPAVLEKNTDGTYYPVQGFRRVTAMLQLAADGIEDPLTCKRDESTGNAIPGTGKPFSTIHAIVYEGLTERERVNLLFDERQRRGLNKAEFFHAMERMFAAGWSEQDVAIMGRSLLEIHYQPNRKIKDDPADVLAYYRGVIQYAKEAWRAPKLLRDAYVEKLQDKQSWPIKSELMEGAKIHTKECGADPLLRYSKENPGPKFMEWWNKLVKAQAEALKTGKPAKVQNAMSRAQIEDVQKNSNSRILRAFCSAILNDGKVDREKLSVLDGLLASKERDFNENENLILNSVFIAPEDVNTPASVVA